MLVIGLPALVMDYVPAFCKYLCPAGTLGGGVPLVLLHGERLHLTVGGLFFWKLAVALVILVLCAVIFRPFCKYLCPLGALYGLTNSFALYRMHTDAGRCTGCGACARVCPMQVDPAKTPNSPECIRCGACTRCCPAQALHLGLRSKVPEPKKKEN